MTREYEILGRFVATHGRKIALARFISSAALTFSLAGVILFGIGVFFSLFPWTVLPLVWDAGIVLALVAIAGFAIFHFIIRPPTLLWSARDLEKRANPTHPLLHIGLELGVGKGTGESEALKEATIRNAVQSLGLYSKHRPRVFSPFLTISAGVVFILVLLSPWFLAPWVGSYWDLPLHSFSRQAVAISPGSVLLPSGASVVLRLKPTAERYPSCRLKISQKNGNDRQYLLRSDSSGTFQFPLDSLRESVVYQFILNGTLLEPYRITIVAPPELRSLAVTLVPPVYTGEKKEELADGQGSFSGRAGTRVQFHIQSHFSLRQAWLIRNNQDSVALPVHGISATGAMVLRERTGYTFGMVDSLGQHNRALPSFLADLLPDAPPSVRIVKPGTDALLRPAQRETLLLEAADDLGLRRLVLQWRRSGEDTMMERPVSIGSGAPVSVRQAVEWNLADLNLYPGDTISYWAKVTDNYPIDGGHVVCSDTFHFRQPGFEEMHEQIATQSSESQQALEHVRHQQRELKQKLDRLDRTGKAQEKANWEEKEVLKDVKEQIAAQQDSLRSAMESLAQAVQKMQEQGIDNKEIMRKTDQVRAAIEELIKQYGDSLLFDKKDPAADITLGDMKDAVERMKEKLPELEKQLDQALNFLAMLRKDQELAAMAERLERMAMRQQEIMQISDAKKQAGQERNALEEMKNLSAELREKSRPDNEKSLLDRNQMSSLPPFDSSLAALSQSVEKGAMPSPSQSNQTTSAMLNLADQIRGMMSTAMMKRLQKETKVLLEIAHDALTLGEWQDQAVRNNSVLDDAETAREQQALIEGVQGSMERLDSLRMVPPGALQSMVRQFDASVLAMKERLASMAGKNEGESFGDAIVRAKAGLNGVAQAALDANRDLASQQQSMAGGEGAGMSGSMRRLSARQAAINAATSALLRQLMQKQGGASGGEGSEGRDGEARREAQAAQKALADQLGRLGGKYGKNGGGEGERLEQLKKEAEELAALLQNPTQELHEKQEQFLSRMLQSSLSMHRQDVGKEERKSTSAITVFSPVDPGKTTSANSAADAFYVLKRRAMEGNLPKQYRSAVGVYFDSLEAHLIK